MNPHTTTLEEVKRRAIMEALEACDGDVALAAQRLGIGRSTPSVPGREEGAA